VKSSLLKRSLIVGVAAFTSVAAFASTVGAASASVITAAGSDTTQNMMNDILSQSYAPAGDSWYNIPSFPSSDVSVPGDANCPTMLFTKAATTAPNLLAPAGSGDGQAALNTFLGSTKKYLNGVESTASNAVGVTGCVDIARSSGFDPKTYALSTMEHYAFALDAVSWATGSLAAPGSMTQSDLIKIYNCTYTDWSQVPGGSAGPIQRYLPQSSSGTGKFFLSDVLGGLVGTADLAAKTNCPEAIRIDMNGAPLEENRADLIPQADWQKAIFPYSAGQWAYQANNAVNPTIDHRMPAGYGGGLKAKLGGLNVSTSALTTGSDNKANNANVVAFSRIDGVWQLNDAGLSVVQPGDPGGYPVVEANTTKASGLTVSTVPFKGVRFVYNILDTRSPDYAKALAAVGFDNSTGGSKSTLCSGGRRSIISSYGFAPLTSTVNGSSNIPGSSCRKY